MAGITDSIVILRLYETEVGNINASEPIKCVAQIPIPIDTAPNITQRDCCKRSEQALIRSKDPKKVNDEIMAIMMDKATR